MDFIGNAEDSMRIRKNLRTMDQRPLLFRYRSAGQAIKDFIKQFVGDEQIEVFGRLAFYNKVVRICLARVQQLAIYRLFSD